MLRQRYQARGHHPFSVLKLDVPVHKAQTVVRVSVQQRREPFEHLWTYFRWKCFGGVFNGWETVVPFVVLHVLRREVPWAEQEKDLVEALGTETQITAFIRPFIY